MDVMYLLIEDKKEIEGAQRALEHTLRLAFPNKRVRNIGYPSSTVWDAKIHTDEVYWYRTDRITDRLDGVSHSRSLNWFGRFKEAGSLHIAVEVNTPLAGRDNMVGGFFVRDAETGMIYLMHSGRVGGGKRGVGQKAFLTWTDRPPEVAIDKEGRERRGIIVMPIEGPAAAQSVMSYVDEVAAFKAFVSEGGVESPQFRDRVLAYADYFDEASGRRRGTRSSKIDYVSRHGDIVRAVREWRNQSLGANDGRIVKSVLLDLGVERSGKLLEAYEIKTSVSRQNLYTAIGQLLVHGGGDECKKYLVYPTDLSIPDDISRALERIGINVLTVMITGTSVRILVD